MTEKDRFIRKVSDACETPYGDKFAEMLDYYEVNALCELTLQEIKEYLVHISN